MPVPFTDHCKMKDAANSHLIAGDLNGLHEGCGCHLAYSHDTAKS